MFLELSNEDLKPEHKGSSARDTTFDKFEDTVQEAIRAVGNATFFGHNRDTYNPIHPPK